MLKMTIRASRLRCRIRRRSSSPENPGRLMSITATSGSWAKKAAKPALPSCASKTSTSGSVSRSARHPETMIGWSSTISTRNGSTLPSADDPSSGASHCNGTGAARDFWSIDSGAGKINGEARKRPRTDVAFDLPAQPAQYHLRLAVRPLALAVDAGRLVLRASARARAETQSAMRLTKDFLATAARRSPGRAGSRTRTPGRSSPVSRTCATCAWESASRRSPPAIVLGEASAV